MSKQGNVSEMSLLTVRVASPAPQGPPEVSGFSGPHMDGRGHCWSECFSAARGEGNSSAHFCFLGLLAHSDLQAEHCLSALIHTRVSVVDNT